VLLFSCGFNTPINGNVTDEFWCGMNHTELWAVDEGGATISTGTGPSGGQNTSDVGDNYAYTEASCSSSTCPADGMSFLTTPLVSGATHVDFFYHMFGANIVNLTVQACDGGMSCTDEWVRVGQQHTATTDPWTFAEVFLPVGTSYVRFMAVRGSSFASDISVDTISVYELTTVPPPPPTPHTHTPPTHYSLPTAIQHASTSGS
jgi:hypothetical protein